MKSLSTLTIVITLAIAATIPFAIGYFTYQSQQTVEDPVLQEIIKKDPATRLKAVEAVTNESSFERLNQLLRRFADPHHFIKAKAAERIYRQGLSREIPSDVLKSALNTLDSDGELTLRWVIANVIAIDYENGFNLFTIHFKKFSSPYSRIFLAQLLANHAEFDTDARAIISKNLKAKGAARAIAHKVQQMLETDRKMWFKRFFPKELVFETVPRRVYLTPPAQE